jgi:predicted Zn-dependent protease
MIALLPASALFASELAVASVPGPDIQIEQQKPAAYEALTHGRTAEAVTQLQAELAKDPDDPALLINLAYAYVAQGKIQLAAQTYRAAIASKSRYELELASGNWEDSRKVAQSSLAAIERSTQLASLDD